MNGYLLEKYQNNSIAVLGNGESRKPLDLDTLERPLIGCNAIHRDIICDHVVAVDRRMVREILDNPNYKNIPIYTREDWVKEFRSNINVRSVPKLPYEGKMKMDDPWHWNSGPFAILIACYLRPKKINLLGFDLYSKNSKLNNVYKNTTNYGSDKDKPVDPSHWLHQLKKIFDCFPEIVFCQWQTKDWTIPQVWQETKNLTIHNF